MVKKICLQCWRPEFSGWVGTIPWKRAWQPTPVFLPGESPQTEEPGGLQSMGSQMGIRIYLKVSIPDRIDPGRLLFLIG